RSSSSDDSREETSVSSSHRKGDNDMSDEVASTSAGLGDCFVCAQPAHGLHFGVLSCRACAAFYRRSVVLSKQYTCRKAKKSCVIDKEERYLCRYCRWQKCLAVGMKADNVQWNRCKIQPERVTARAIERQETSPPRFTAQHDTKPSDGERMEFFPVIRFLKKPDENAGSPTGLSHPSNATNLMWDMSDLIENVASIFEKPPIMRDLGIKMTTMQRMLKGLHHLRRNQNRKPEIVSSFSSSRWKSVWDRQLFAMPECAMHFEEFVQLPGDQKLALHKGSCKSFFRLERYHLTATIFGRRMIEKGVHKSMILVVNDEVAVDFVTTDFDFSCITDYDPATMLRLHMPAMKRLFLEVARPMIELQVTDTELVYIMGQLMWHLEGKEGISSDTRAISESFRSRISNELHDYYVYEMKMHNYAARLMRLMGIVTDLENIMDERQKLIELARILDVFKIDLHDSGSRSNKDVTSLADLV
ncbi:hypothetical protein PMAYCL1PPCAC_21251, partial [Pristionchus mayeri]